MLAITLGYAQAARADWMRQLWVLVRSYPDMLAAVAGFACWCWPG